MFWNCLLLERRPTDAHKVEESVELRVFSPSFRPTRERMLEMLAQAKLDTEHGFTKEVTVKESITYPGGETTFEEMHYYYKIVPCFAVGTVEREVDALLRGDYNYPVVSQ